MSLVFLRPPLKSLAIRTSTSGKKAETMAVVSTCGQRQSMRIQILFTGSISLISEGHPTDGNPNGRFVLLRLPRIECLQATNAGEERKKYS